MTTPEAAPQLTPGPWLIVTENQPDDPPRVFIQSWPPDHHYRVRIAELNEQMAATDANARLIAAAPALLAAMEAILRTTDYATIQAKARAAIARARGGQQ